MLAEDEHEQTQHQHAQRWDRVPGSANQVPNKRHDGHGRNSERKGSSGRSRSQAAQCSVGTGGEQHPIDGEEHRADGRDGQGARRCREQGQIIGFDDLRLKPD